MLGFGTCVGCANALLNTQCFVIVAEFHVNMILVSIHKNVIGWEFFSVEPFMDGMRTQFIALE